MQPHSPPDRIRQAVAATGYIEDHALALAIVKQLNDAPTAYDAVEAGRKALAFLTVHMAEEEANDGVFHWLVALNSSLEEEVARLVVQHREVREALKALTGAHEGNALELARQLAELLEEHEAAERAALDRALQRG